MGEEVTADDTPLSPAATCNHTVVSQSALIKQGHSSEHAGAVCPGPARRARAEAEAHISDLEARMAAATLREQGMVVNMPPLIPMHQPAGGSVGC